MQPGVTQRLQVASRHQHRLINLGRRREQDLVGNRASSDRRFIQCGQEHTPTLPQQRRWTGRQRSTSPTTKKIEPRIEMRSGTSWPGRIAGMTLTFEKDGVRIFTR